MAKVEIRKKGINPLFNFTFTFIKVIFIIILIFLAFLIGWLKGNINYLPEDNSAAEMNKAIYDITDLQEAIIDLDSGKADKVRRYLVEFQDKKIHDCFPTLNLNYPLHEMHKIEAIKAIQNVNHYRKRNNSIYYPNGKYFIFKNTEIDSFIVKSNKYKVPPIIE
jgi:hypothetical protein